MSCPTCGEWCQDAYHAQAWFVRATKTEEALREILALRESLPAARRIAEEALSPNAAEDDLVTTRLIEAMADYNANIDHPLAGFEEAHTISPGRVLFRMDGDSYVVRVTPQPDEWEKEALAEYEFALARGLSDHEARDLAWPETDPGLNPERTQKE